LSHLLAVKQSGTASDCLIEVELMLTTTTL
jgi:hypothetical protein